MSKQVSWTALKDRQARLDLPFDWLEEDEFYLVALQSLSDKFICIIDKTESSSDLTDFETNVKPNPATVSEGSNRIRVTTELDQADLTNGAIATSCRLSSNFKILFDEDNITVPSSYTTLYSYSGSGAFHGGVFDFNSDSVRVKLTIDGNQVFELTLDEVELIQSFSSGGCNDGGTQNVKFVTKTSGNRLNICFDCPISYSSSVLVEAQRTSGSDKRQDRQIVYITKES